MTTTKDRWRRGERVKHRLLGHTLSARVIHVEDTGLAQAESTSGRIHALRPIAVEYADQKGWRRDRQDELFDEEERAALGNAGAWQ